MADSNTYDEKQLLHLVADGDETAFRKLFALYIPFLQPTLLRIVKDVEAVDDIVQETFLRIWITRDKLTEIESPRSWVLRIAYNRAFSYMRDKLTRDRLLQGVSTSNQHNLNPSEEILAFKALSHLVSQAISLLPTQQKKVYRLSREQGLSIAQIAEAMDISPQTVKNTLGRALKFIREFIEKRGYLLGLFHGLLSAQKYF